MDRVHKEDLQRFMMGYRKEPEVFFQERVKRIRRLTVENSRQSYNHLCEWWQMNRDRSPLGESFNNWRIKEIISIRQRFDKLGLKRTDK